MTPVVVKVGGSLFDWPDLRPRLLAWLHALARPTLLVPGGGAMADVVRDYDRVHGLGERRSHRLAMMTMSLNAEFLGELLGLHVTDDYTFTTPARVLRRYDVDLPASWAVTSDSIAAAVARSCGAELVLLKSVDSNGELSQGYVDEYFPIAARGLVVRGLNLRESIIQFT